HDGRRRREQPWRGWYNTATWQRLREQQLAAGPLCQCEDCQRLDPLMRPAASVVDRVADHQGHWAKVGDPEHLMALSERCRDRKTGRTAHGRGAAAAVSGGGRGV